MVVVFVRPGLLIFRGAEKLCYVVRDNPLCERLGPIEQLPL